MLFEEELDKQVRELATPGATVVLAVSGGPDSTALLLGWAKLAHGHGHQLHVAHFDHRYRTESALDAQRVCDLAQRLGLPYHCHAAAGHERFTEQSARNWRYSFFAELAQNIGAGFVATGHTRDDQIETVLHCILRGTGVHGLAGIPVSRPLCDGVQLIRPLLDQTRQHVMEYLKTQQIEAAIDETNADRRFLRNRIRLELLPLLRRDYNANVDEAIHRLSELAKSSSSILDQMSAELFAASVNSSEADLVELDLLTLREAGADRVTELIRWLFASKNWPRQRLGFAEYRRVSRLVFSDEPRAWDLPCGYFARRTRTALRVGKTSKPADDDGAPDPL